MVKDKLLGVGSKIQWLLKIRQDVDDLIKSLTPLVSDTHDSN